MVKSWHVAGWVTGAMMLLFAAISVPSTAGLPAYWNSHARGLVIDHAILKHNGLASTAFNVSYKYTDVNDKVRTAFITDDVTDGQVTNATFQTDTRIMSLDFGSIVLPKNPTFKHAAEPELVIEMPDNASTLLANDAAEMCIGLQVDRGDTAAKPDLVTYVITVGADDPAGAKSILYSRAVAPTDSAGDANTNEFGTCQGHSDAADKLNLYTVSLLGQDQTITPLQKFLNDAYVTKNVAKPQKLWVKITGIRGESDAVGATETGDQFDVGIQFYTWSGARLSYVNGDTNGHMLLGGVTAFGLVVIIMWSFRHHNVANSNLAAKRVGGGL